jgi:Protein of unknown function (DUF692)
VEAGHLLPVPRTRAGLDVLVRNVRAVTAELDAPLALEHPASLSRWPDDDGWPLVDFLTELVDRTEAMIVLDLANLHADRRNHGLDPAAFLDRLPWERVAYVHVAGGVERGGLYHDTHRHPLTPAVLTLLADAAGRAPRALAVMLERDGDYPSARELDAELDAVAAAISTRHPPAGRRRPPSPASPATRGPAAAPGPAAADLRSRQADLVRALVAGAADPPGFDRARLAATRAALLDKRAREVAAAWPALAAGAEFSARFTRFAASAPPRDPYSDGRAFAESVRADLDGPALAELLIRTLPRRWFAARAGRPAPAAAPVRWIVAVRLPFGRVWLHPRGDVGARC